MSKLWKRLSTEEFQNLFRSGKFLSGKLISINVEFGCSNKSVGFAVKRDRRKKESVERNRIRRRLREAFLKVQDFLPEGLKIAIIGKSESEFAPIDEISAEILRLVEIKENKR